MFCTTEIKNERRTPGGDHLSSQHRYTSWNHALCLVFHRKHTHRTPHTRHHMREPRAGVVSELLNCGGRTVAVSHGQPFFFFYFSPRSADWPSHRDRSREIGLGGLVHVQEIAAHSCFLFGGGGLKRSECDRHENQRRRSWMLSNYNICVILIPLAAGTPGP